VMRHYRHSRNPQAEKNEDDPSGFHVELSS
jgi:hypothetical protein